MNSTEQDVRARHFVEELGLLFSESGLAPMMGRIIGHLLICDPPEQSSQALAQALDASKGAISTTTRQLSSLGMIEKVRLKGERSTFFRLRSHAWVDWSRGEMARLTMMRELAERGLALLEDEPQRADRLRSFHAFYSHVEREMPAMLDRWVAAHGEEP